MCHHGSVANAIARMNTSACSWSRSQAARWGSMSAIAKFSAWIFSPFIPPEQSARMMKCSGRREMPPPGIRGYEAAWVITQCEYGYTSDLSLKAMMDDDVLVAWAHGGEPLAAEHGFPLRLVVPKRYAWKSAKWLRGLEFTDRNERGFWEVRGYHIHADPWPEERYSYQESPRAELEP